MTDYEKDCAEKVMELIEHLDYVKMESHKLIAVSEAGLVIYNENLKADVKMARESVMQMLDVLRKNLKPEKSLPTEIVKESSSVI